MKKYTDIIYGLRPIMEAIDAGQSIEKVMVQKGRGGDTFGELDELLKKHRIMRQAVPEEKLNKFTRKNHQGIVAFISPIHFQRIGDVLPMVYEKGEVPLVVVLDGVTDVRNFGAIVRTVECAGAHAVVVPYKGAARIGDDAAKTSAGALFKVPICREHSLMESVEYMKTHGLQIIAATEKANGTLYDQDFSTPTVIVMGSEESGVSAEVLATSDGTIALPMHGTLGSLNVSVATGIVLYEALRQRHATP